MAHGRIATALARFFVFAILMASLSVAGSGCSKSSAPSGRADLIVRSDLNEAEADQVHIAITGRNTVERTVSHPKGAGARQVAHYTLAFDPGEGTEFTITATALLNGTPGVEQGRKFVGNSDSVGTTVELALERACVGKTCGAGTWCFSGQCAAPDRPGVGREDGGARDSRLGATDALGDAPSSTDAAGPPAPQVDAEPLPAPCAADEIRCNGLCVKRTAEHCGDDCKSCPAVSGGDVACVQGQCQTTCNPGKDKCAGACIAGGAPCNGVCPANTHKCGEECLADDATASCGTRCQPCVPPANSQAVCAAGACDFQCNPGYHRCGDACFADTDADHCGAACTFCPRPPGATPVCANGACSLNCGTLKNCGDHCAACCNSDDCTGYPGATGICGAAGTCSFGACKAGFANCNGSTGDGCEVNTNTSVDNCGACGTKCADYVGTSIHQSNVRCESGGCAVTCYPPGHATQCRQRPNAPYIQCEEAFRPPTGDPNWDAAKSTACYTTCATGRYDCDSKRDNGCESAVKNTGCQTYRNYPGE